MIDRTSGVVLEVGNCVIGVRDIALPERVRGSRALPRANKEEEVRLPITASDREPPAAGSSTPKSDRPRNGIGWSLLVGVVVEKETVPGDKSDFVTNLSQLAAGLFPATAGEDAIDVLIDVAAKAVRVQTSRARDYTLRDTLSPSKRNGDDNAPFSFLARDCLLRATGAAEAVPDCGVWLELPRGIPSAECPLRLLHACLLGCDSTDHGKVSLVPSARSSVLGTQWSELGQELLAGGQLIAEQHCTLISPANALGWHVWVAKLSGDRSVWMLANPRSRLLWSHVTSKPERRRPSDVSDPSNAGTSTTQFPAIRMSPQGKGTGLLSRPSLPDAVDNWLRRCLHGATTSLSPSPSAAEFTPRKRGGNTAAVTPFSPASSAHRVRSSARSERSRASSPIASTSSHSGSRTAKHRRGSAGDIAVRLEPLLRTPGPPARSHVGEGTPIATMHRRRRHSAVDVDAVRTVRGRPWGGPSASRGTPSSSASRPPSVAGATRAARQRPMGGRRLRRASDEWQPTQTVAQTQTHTGALRPYPPQGGPPRRPQPPRRASRTGEESVASEERTLFTPRRRFSEGNQAGSAGGNGSKAPETTPSFLRIDMAPEDATMPLRLQFDQESRASARDSEDLDTAVLLSPQRRGED